VTTAAERDNRDRSSRSHASKAATSGAHCSRRTRRRTSAFGPLMPRSMSNSASMRLTVASTIGGIAVAFLPLAAMLVNSKN